jgi:hypothetical protein
MAARHGTRRGYTEGCRCDDCITAQRLYQQRYRERSLSPLTDARTARAGPGPVESGAQAEIGGPAAEARPGLAQMALAMARILDSKAVNQQPAEVKVLATLLDKLHQAGTPGRLGHLATVRAMTDKRRLRACR